MFMFSLFNIEMKMCTSQTLLLLCIVFNLTEALVLDTCSSSQIYSKHACEDEEMVLSCPKDMVIKVSSTQYGRTRTDICPGPIHNTSCKAPSSQFILKKACSGKNECTIRADNDIFGDPCLNTLNYLEVKYCCIFLIAPNPVGCDSAPQVETACSSKVLSLICQVGTLKVLSANYGRTDSDTCPYGPIETTNCHAENSTEIVSKRCNSRSECNVFADYHVFGDPCFGTFKYLTAQFCCKWDH
ncbi:unnamed protein product [Brassicogethes aeneus]|uniref:SUEL-type lectin domain-containing protein n=1 Tax=Brassicogethes aeneus TaxID=1431903 RepID=A0A9P0FPK5_BRAAE|nr:unnamed protein product [Brassicogethes aeneus]